MKKYIVLLTVSLILFCQVPTTLALYRGDEYELRSYRIGSRFFINRVTYEINPIQRKRFDDVPSAYLGAAGSLSSNDLYLYQHLKINHPLHEAVTFRARYLEDRDFDGFYRHFNVGLAWWLTDFFAVEVIGEPDAQKEFADIGGAIAYRDEYLQWRVQVLYPNFVFNDKVAYEAEQDNVPNLQVDIRLQPSPKFSARVSADLDFPRWLKVPEESFDFRFEKYQGAGEIQWAFWSRGQFILSAEGELASQVREGREPGDERAFDLDRTYWQARLEYWQDLKHNAYFRLGALWIQFDEDLVFPFQQVASVWRERQDAIMYIGRTWHLGRSVYLNTMLLGDVLQEDLVSDEEERTGSSRFLSRAAGSVLFLGETYSLEGGAAANLHESRFGGGFVRVCVDF